MLVILCVRQLIVLKSCVQFLTSQGSVCNRSLICSCVYVPCFFFCCFFLTTKIIGENCLALPTQLEASLCVWLPQISSFFVLIFPPLILKRVLGLWTKYLNWLLQTSHLRKWFVNVSPPPLKSLVFFVKGWFFLLPFGGFWFVFLIAVLTVQDL